MGVFESFTLSDWCHSNQHCLELAKKHMSSRREAASFTLGLVSVIVWVVAEIPQIITNYKAKSTDGLSATFLITWIIGDLFNLFGCILEPATLPTQLYMAVLYTFVTVALGSQSIYYGYIYKRQLKVETPTKVSDAEQSHEFDDFSRGAVLSSPIPLPAHLPSISTGRELFYQSARSLTKTHTPTSGSILAQRMTPNSPFLDSLKENLLGSAFARQSAPSLKIKSTLCLVSTLSFFGVINLYKSVDKGINPMVSNPRQQFVVYVGRKLFQVSGDQLLENGASGNSSIGTFLGWAMTFLYLSGRMPQIWLNIRRGHAEGLNPLMFLFALIGNATYVASILVSSLDWSNIRPNLPWLVDAGGCVLLDFFILMQFLYFRCQTSPGL
ncbi:probable vacuolar amino acid transporter YPQ2 [Vicia villosa]|uniref:probable vacuolar amino acid transporter YPQ2 n=1 Tax=Vicia villosa TaxID=3911 RepID=UPI00273A80D9|nr:probable vacuolar amino acid transporter YPQ2 [Vicia villosa]